MPGNTQKCKLKKGETSKTHLIDFPMRKKVFEQQKCRIYLICLSVAYKIIVICFSLHFQLSEFMNRMKLESQDVGITMFDADQSIRLPPSSLHSFLKTNESIPGVVITDHEREYTNRYSRA